MTRGSRRSLLLVRAVRQCRPDRRQGIAGGVVICCGKGNNAGDGLVIRRVIAANNRHRIYINNRLMTAQSLTEIADMCGIAGIVAEAPPKDGEL